ncbi:MULTISPECIES: tyrosine-type recombinase/integrase [unclassified Streptomyces]|uniref:tyrosine-type recombinase/integrase n=1 Tax=unclassified Streptomyces TaxID=2593676 RepID=UPI002DD7EBDD|nr:tyrosine-type recombinase/integrase [Streptomyces sp. NBC_01775]WSB81133.1 site-specific integrase [Streptomyces sp. NBC_01775]WSS39352.1 site-specific integrase [Streptomyces sp. NBC_01187]
MQGYIEDRWLKKRKDPITGKRERTSRYGKGQRYRVAGIPGVRDRSFEILEDAKAWLHQSSTDEKRGEFVDPRDGSITLADYIKQYWVPGRTGAPKTRDGTERRVRLHILPYLGHLPLRQVTAAELRGYLVQLENTVTSVDYRRSILGELSGILETAVDDRRISSNPVRSKSVRWPKASKGHREAWPLETALHVRDVISERHRIAVVLGLGCGLRQGEVFGLSVDDIDWGRGVVYVRQQVQALKGKLYYALPKGGKARTADLPASVAVELKQHIERFPPVEVELPWGDTGADRPRKRFALLLTTRYGNAIAVNTWNTYTWKPALAKAGIIPAKTPGTKPWQWAAAPQDGFHVLRHTYASTMLEAGESVVTLARWLGHSSPTITLDHYAHFMPEAGDRGRSAIDALLDGAETGAAEGDAADGRNSPETPQRRSGLIVEIGPQKPAVDLKAMPPYSLAECFQKSQPPAMSHPCGRVAHSPGSSKRTTWVLTS